MQRNGPHLRTRVIPKGRLAGQSVVESNREKARTMNEESDIRQPDGSQRNGHHGPSFPYGDTIVTSKAGCYLSGGTITHVRSKMSNELNMNDG